MWSAIPVALLSMVVNRSETKQGSGPEGDEVLYNTGGTFVRLSIRPSIRQSPQALSGLKYTPSGLKYALTGLNSVLSCLESEGLEGKNWA